MTHAIDFAEARETRLVLFHSNAAGNPIVRQQNCFVRSLAKRAEDRALRGRTVVFRIHAAGTDSGFSVVDESFVVQVCYLLYLCAPHRCYWAVLSEMQCMRITIGVVPGIRPKVQCNLLLCPHHLWLHSRHVSRIFRVVLLAYDRLAQAPSK